ncbi:MAG: GntR family transcriptional regulator [Alloprevotella sp.]|nr:GntR family transcriptional regulator [Alloprevotella sp.]
MLKLGDYNVLPIVRFSDHGAYLDGGEIGEILMPKAFVRPEMKVGDEEKVFVYLDQQERLVATKEKPLARVGDFACLRVAWTNHFGAFLDWGLMKDLFVPFSEQTIKMEVDKKYLVYIFVDQLSHRIVASAKLNRYIQPAPQEYETGREVSVLVQGKSPLGLKVIIDNRFAGLCYANQLHRFYHPGERLTGFVVKRREDGKLDISLSPLGMERVEQFSQQLKQALIEAGGSLPFSDHSTAEEIEKRFHVSKKTFKQAIGRLYKAHLIQLSDHEIWISGED